MNSENSFLMAYEMQKIDLWKNFRLKYFYTMNLFLLSANKQNFSNKSTPVKKIKSLT